MTLTNRYVRVINNLNVDLFNRWKEGNLTDFGDVYYIDDMGEPAVNIHTEIWDMLYQDAQFYTTPSLYDILLHILSKYYSKEPDNRSSDRALRDYIDDMKRQYPDFNKIVRYTSFILDAFANKMPHARIVRK